MSYLGSVWYGFVILNYKYIASNKNSFRIKTNRVQPKIHHIQTRTELCKSARAFLVGFGLEIDKMSGLIWA